MAQILRTVSPGTTWPDRVTELLNKEFLTNPLVSQESLGHPSKWNTHIFDGQQVDSYTDCHVPEIITHNASVTTTHEDSSLPNED